MNIHYEIMKVLQGILIMKDPITQTSLKKLEWVPPYGRDGEYAVPCGICALGQLKVLQTLDVLAETHTVRSTQPSLLFYPPSCITENQEHYLPHGISINSMKKLFLLSASHHLSLFINMLAFPMSFLSITIQVLFGVIGFLDG